MQQVGNKRNQVDQEPISKLLKPETGIQKLEKPGAKTGNRKIKMMKQRQKFKASIP